MTTAFWRNRTSTQTWRQSNYQGLCWAAEWFYSPKRSTSSNPAFEISQHHKILWGITDMVRPGGKAGTSGLLLKLVSQHIYILLYTCIARCILVSCLHHDFCLLQYSIATDARETYPQGKSKTILNFNSYILLPCLVNYK